MKLSEALRSGRRPDLEQLSLHRYGYSGSLDDTGALVDWLEAHPLIDVEVTPEPSATKATRPEQAEFRKLLLEAYDGHCAVTDCDIAETLEAAHLSLTEFHSSPLETNRRLEGYIQAYRNWRPPREPCP